MKQEVKVFYEVLTRFLGLRLARRIHSGCGSRAIDAQRLDDPSFNMVKLMHNQAIGNEKILNRAIGDE